MAYSNAPWPFYSDEERDAVDQVLASGKVNYWTGTEGREFEKEFAEFTGVDHAIFVANGTLALELGLRALNLPSGSDVMATPRTYMASSSAIVAAGLRPVFADVDPDSGNITPDSVRDALSTNTSAVLGMKRGPATQGTIPRRRLRASGNWIPTECKELLRCLLVAGNGKDHTV